MRKASSQRVTEFAAATGGTKPPPELLHAEAQAKQQAEARAAELEGIRRNFQLGMQIQAASYIAAVNQMNELCGSWFTDIQGFSAQNFPGDLMLITTELAEACEGDRKPGPDPDCPQFDSREVEVADALVRIHHLARKYNLRLAEALVAKMGVNLNRPFKHGKGY